MHPVNEVLRSLSPRRVADTVDRCSRFRYAKPAAFAVQSPSAASLIATEMNRPSVEQFWFLLELFLCSPATLIYRPSGCWKY
jgi:hypothetical protein